MDRWVIEKAIRITGFAADLDFDSSFGASLKRKLSANDLSGVDNSTFSLKWSGDTHLTVLSKDPFYIWGEKSRWAKDSFALAGGSSDYKLTPDKEMVPDNAHVVDDRPK